jgi:tetratricopeptide (TPR) repeat protein
MSKHLSKEELQSDALLSFYGQALVYYNQNKSKVITIASSIAVVIALGITYVFVSASNEEKAQMLLYQAEQYFASSDWERALNGDASTGTAGFASIVANYGRTDAGNLAAYFAAVSSMNLGNNEDALMYIRKHDAPNDVIGLGATTLHASIEANAGNFKEAGNLYLKASKMADSDTNTPQQLLLAAIHFMAGNLTSEALEAVNQIIEEYPDSPQVLEARKISAQLSAV